MGTAGTVTINNAGTGVQANALTFNTTGYSITSAAAGDVLTLAGTSPTVTVTGAALVDTINSTLAGTAGFAKSGAGTLVLSADNLATLNGPVAVDQGRLTLTNLNGLGAEQQQSPPRGRWS